MQSFLAPVFATEILQGKKEEGVLPDLPVDHDGKTRAQHLGLLHTVSADDGTTLTGLDEVIDSVPETVIVTGVTLHTRTHAGTNTHTLLNINNR